MSVITEENLKDLGYHVTSKDRRDSFILTVLSLFVVGSYFYISSTYY